MFARLADLDADIPVTALYGETSWITAIPEEEFKTVRKDTGYNKMHIIPDAGHHIYANPQAFNARVLDACNYSDKLSHEK